MYPKEILPEGNHWSWRERWRPYTRSRKIANPGKPLFSPGKQTMGLQNQEEQKLPGRKNLLTHNISTSTEKISPIQ